ncbi:MAG TPA: ROK family protein, partial [Pseudonocardiaceae bacterium]|nr:ROK family protein [Pseudonocardiaceae bacterium]
ITALLRRGRGRPVSPAELDALLDAGDQGARRAVEDAADAVGRALAPTVMLLNPELVVVGGDLSTAGETLLAPMRRTLTRLVMTSHNRALRIVAGALGDSAGVRGAAALVLETAAQRLGATDRKPAA